MTATKTAQRDAIRALEAAYNRREFTDPMCRHGICQCTDEPGVHDASRHRGTYHEATCTYCGATITREQEGSPWSHGPDAPQGCPTPTPAVPAPLPALPPGVMPLAVRNWSPLGGDNAATWTVVLIRYARRKYGGWEVRRADNGRDLGWLTKHDDGTWDARISSLAFRGDGLDDTGYVLDRVPADLYNGDPNDSLNSLAIARGEETREHGAEAIVRWLVEHRAPAVGYGRHPRVVLSLYRGD